MPRLNVDYSKTVIYKIQHNDDETLLYVGSTTNFNNRKSQHKNSCKNERDKQHHLKVYKMIRENGGWDCFSMTKIEDYPCENGRDAEAREDQLMRELKANMNSVRAFLTPEEKLELHQRCQLNWRERNREYEVQRVMRWREETDTRVYCEACDIDFFHRHLNAHRQTDRHNNNIVRLMEEGAAARAEQ
jgi:hypothetical protein